MEGGQPPTLRLAESVLAIRDAKIGGVVGLTVVLELAEIATIQSCGWHLGIAGAGTVLGHGLTDGDIHFLVRREAPPGVANLAKLGRLRAGRGCLLAGSDQGLGLLKKTNCRRRGSGLPSRAWWCRTSWTRGHKGLAARLKN